MRITAAVVEAPGEPFTVQQVDLDEPREHEVLVRIVATGICHTDLSARAGTTFAFPFPVVLGHEGAGVVERAGSAVTRLQPGDHVVLSFYACHECPTCRAGRHAYCPHSVTPNYSGGRADGSRPIGRDGQPLSSSFFSQSSFATYAVAHEQNTVKVPNDLPLELLGPLGCGLQTGAGAVLNSLAVQPGQSIAVFGTGAVGMAAIMAARVAGAETIIGVDLKAERLELARELGATHTLKADETNVVQDIKSIVKGGVDFTLECIGTPDALRQAFDAVRVLGTCALVGLPPQGAEVAVPMRALYGRRLIGIIEGDSDPQTFIGDLIELHRDGKFPFDRLVKSYPFERINEAVRDMQSGTTIKPILRMP